jgi:sugar lactone lactonase YvrE
MFGAGPAWAAAGGFNTPGNILISDQFNNRVIEVNRQGQIVWSFGSGNPNLCNPGPGTVIAPNDVERLAYGLTLIAGTGTTSCADNRVIIVDEAGNIVFQYGQAGVSGKGPNELNTPVYAIQRPSGTLLITDQANNRVIEVDQTGKIVSRIDHGLNTPNSAVDSVSQPGLVVIADEGNSRVLGIYPANETRPYLLFRRGLNQVASAVQLSDNDLLMADSGNNRVLEVNASKKTVFKYYTNLGQGSNANPNPTSAMRLRDGNTLIADQFNDRVILVTKGKRILFQYGTTNVVGNGPNQLNAPYSAMAIGDYTGVDVPPGF